ncbi:DUF418 domain-containing protein [Shouchella lonarensis]|uniref:DUF418 domain-containing protein n=1 Tax=Shouchella lonarensis TaxID=1464122 RepID=A0A1G6GIM6_9BACI|nr:DUF418 domain-containing protein [Shouchella lonarensis]SDB81683.1 uncharacterized protein SAMN05421737_10198 [Shouchella lonarensis]
MNQHTQPLGRIDVLDGLRGITLLFIFIVHLSQFFTPSTMGNLTTNAYVLFSNSSYPLFAFMFGISVVLLYDRLQKRELNPTPILFRRMLILAPFGLIHLLFIFSGDALFSYAIAGLMLLLLVKIPQKWLLTLSIFFFVRGIAGNDIAQLIGIPLDISSMLPESFSVVTSYFDRALGDLTYMLPGMYAYRAGLFTHLPKNRRLLWIGAPIFLIIGITVKALFFYDMVDNVSITILQLACLLVTTGYIFLFLAIGTSNKKVRSLLIPFQAVGRMAFTNYLLQSLICVMLAIDTEHAYFSGWGLIGEISEISLYGLGLFIFLLQILFSHFWLKRFSYGPLEWIWRMGTYWKIVPMKRKIVVTDNKQKASGM